MIDMLIHQQEDYFSETVILGRPCPICCSMDLVVHSHLPIPGHQTMYCSRGKSLSKGGISGPCLHARDTLSTSFQPSCLRHFFCQTLV